MVKITYSEEVWVNGNKVSEVTLEDNNIMNDITFYSDKVSEFEKIVDAHKGEKMVNDYDLTTQNFANGESVVLTYYYEPAGLTILRGVSYQRVKEEENV